MEDHDNTGVIITSSTQALPQFVQNLTVNSIGIGVASEDGVSVVGGPSVSYSTGGHVGVGLSPGEHAGAHPGTLIPPPGMEGRESAEVQTESPEGR
jgi:hypothetical protein